MRLDNHEKHIKKSLQAHQPDVDIEALWDVLEPELHPKKKRRRGLVFWWFGGAFGILLIAAYFHYYGPINKSSANTQHDSAITAKAPKSTTYDNAYEKNNRSGQLQPTAKNAPTTIKENTNTNEAEQNTHSSTAATVVNQYQTVAATKNTVTTTKNNTHNATTKLNQKIGSKTHESGTIAKTDIPATTSKSTLSSNFHKESMSNKRSMSSHENYLHPDEKAAELNSKSNKNKNQLLAKDVLLFDPLAHPEIGLLERNSSVTFAPPIVKPKRRTSAWSVYASSGWGNFDQTFTSEDKEYESFVTSTNSPVSSQHVELGVSKQFKGKWRLSLGVHYGRFVQRSTLRDIIVIDTMIAGVTETYYMRSGQTTTVTGYLPAQRRIKNNIRWHSYEQQINLPLSIGYEFTSRRWAITPQIGIQYELHTINNGAYINADRKLVTYSNNDINIETKSQHRFTPHARLEGSYSLSGRQRLFISSAIVGKKARMLQFDNTIKETRKSIYFSLGTSYTF